MRGGRLEPGGPSGRWGEVGRRWSRRVNAALTGTGGSAGGTGCSQPSERSPGINPPSLPLPPLLLPPPSSLPALPHWAQQAQGGCWCYASNETDPGSAWALSSAEACPPSTRFCPDTRESPLCSHRSGRSPARREPNRRPVPERSESVPGSVQLSCCGNTCAGQPIWGIDGEGQCVHVENGYIDQSVWRGGNYKVHPTCASSDSEVVLARGSLCTSSSSVVSPRSEGMQRHLSIDSCQDTSVDKLFLYLQTGRNDVLRTSITFLCCL